MGSRSTRYGAKEYNSQARAILQYTRIQSMMRVLPVPNKPTTSTKTVTHNPIMSFSYRIYLLKNHHLEPVIATAHAKALFYAKDNSRQLLSPVWLRRRTQSYNKLERRKAKTTTNNKDHQLRRRVVLCLSTSKNHGSARYKKIAEMLETQIDKTRRKYSKIIRMLSAMTVGQLEEKSQDYNKIHKLVRRRYAEWLARSDRERINTPRKNVDSTTVMHFKAALHHFENPSNWKDGRYIPASKSENSALHVYLREIRFDESNNNMRRTYFEERGLGVFVNKEEWEKLIANKIGSSRDEGTSFDNTLGFEHTEEEYDFSQ